MMTSPTRRTGTTAGFRTSSATAAGVAPSAGTTTPWSAPSLLSVKHHLGDMAYVTSIAEPDREGWQAAFELYFRTFPEREIPVLDNWPRSER